VTNTTAAAAAMMPATQAWGVLDFHHVEIYVTNTVQATYYYRTVLGLEVTAMTGPQTGFSDRRSVVLERGNLRVMLTSPLSAGNDVARHIERHGEGVKDIALSVRGLDATLERAASRGYEVLQAPARQGDGPGAARTGVLKSCGALTHSLIESDSGNSQALPGFVAATPAPLPSDIGLCGIDHVAISVASESFEAICDGYVEGFGFHESHQEDVATEYSGMRSKVVQNEQGSVRFPIVTPAPGKRRSQIEEYLRAHDGAGAQHLAFRCKDLPETVRKLKASGVEFLPVTPAYYDAVEARTGPLGADLDTFRRLGILADRDAQGLLLQVFTRPVGTRPTLFFEFVERRGARGFGSANIRALFEAVERDQAARAQ
jgi:4-hydroxyphenylpyruvate dioxygenase